MFVCSGYMSPEYAMRGLFSEKSDVFSFGVLLLEIVSGRRNTSICDEEQYSGLAGLVNLTNNIHNIRKFSQTLIKSYFIYLIYLFIFLHCLLSKRLDNFNFCLSHLSFFKHGNCGTMTTLWLQQTQQYGIHPFKWTFRNVYMSDYCACKNWQEIGQMCLLLFQCLRVRFWICPLPSNLPSWKGKFLQIQSLLNRVK